MKRYHCKIKVPGILVYRNDRFKDKFKCYALLLGGWWYMTNKEIKETGFKVIEK
jgi:hypothetical protein